MFFLSSVLTASLTAPVRVWDNVFAPADLSILSKSGNNRKHSFTTIFDRHASPDGRTVLERALASVLDEMGDDAQYVEYWWRGEWKSIEAHRDVDETLCISKLHVADGKCGGVQRCPDHGHVLYIDVADDVRGPTCLWEEAAFDGAPATPPKSEVAGPEGEDLRAGSPRELTALHVVPSVGGRLLRFPGALLHAVPRPACEWLPLEDVAAPEADVSAEDADGQHAQAAKVPATAASVDAPMTTGGAKGSGAKVSGAKVSGAPPMRREVVLFNTWTTPPQVPPPNDPPPPKYIEELARLATPPTCQPRGSWADAPGASTNKGAAGDGVVASGDGADGEALPGEAVVRAALLGDVRRRNTKSACLASRADATSARAALTSTETVHRIPLYPVADGTVEAAAASSSPADTLVSAETAAAEEVAVKVGYLDYMEDEFFDLDDDDEEEEGKEGGYREEEEEEEEEGLGALSGDFLANLAALQALQGGGGAEP